MTRKSLREVKEANRRIGHHWFSPATLEFFKSRVSETTYDGGDAGTVIVTSECPPSGRRMWSVALASPTGEVNRLVDICSYASDRQAHRGAVDAARLLSGGIDEDRVREYLIKHAGGEFATGRRP